MKKEKRNEGKGRAERANESEQSDHASGGTSERDQIAKDRKFKMKGDMREQGELAGRA